MAINPVACFNSTLVQLKALRYPKMISINFRFNSTLVQLKVQTSKKSLSSCKRFNSTLVQLKACYLGFAKITTKRFNSTLVQLKAVKNANKYTSKSMIYHPFILIFYKHLQSTFNS